VVERDGPEHARALVFMRVGLPALFDCDYIDPALVDLIVGNAPERRSPANKRGRIVVVFGKTQGAGE
jgi:hypothetical protein